MINASEIDSAGLVANIICNVLIEFVRGTTDKELTFAEAGKIALSILKNMVKHTKYGIENNQVFGLKTNTEVSPGGLKH